MSRPVRAKYCPQCRTMNALGAETCLHCGRPFRTGLSAAPPPEAPPPVDDLHRTQMFLLPPVAPPPADRPLPEPGRPARLRAALASLNGPLLLAAAVLLVAAAAALLGWASSLGLLRL